MKEHLYFVCPTDYFEPIINILFYPNYLNKKIKELQLEPAGLKMGQVKIEVKIYNE